MVSIQLSQLLPQLAEVLVVELVMLATYLVMPVVLVVEVELTQPQLHLEEPEQLIRVMPEVLTVDKLHLHTQLEAVVEQYLLVETLMDH
jgi:hypothetical protein